MKVLPGGCLMIPPNLLLGFPFARGVWKGNRHYYGSNRRSMQLAGPKTCTILQSANPAATVLQAGQNVRALLQQPDTRCAPLLPSLTAILFASNRPPETNCRSGWFEPGASGP